MIEHNALTLIQAFTQLEIIIQGLYQYPELRIEMRADEKDRIARSSAFVWIEAHRNVLTDDDLHLRIWALRNGLSGNNPYSAEALIHELEGNSPIFPAVLRNTSSKTSYSATQCTT